MKEFVIRWEDKGKFSVITVGKYRNKIFRPIKKYSGNPELILKEVLREIEKSR